MSHQEIGEIRCTVVQTVRNAMSKIQRKLGFRTRQPLVAWAMRIGLVDDRPRGRWGGDGNPIRASTESPSAIGRGKGEGEGPNPRG